MRLSTTDAAQIVSSAAAVLALFLIWLQLRLQNTQNKLTALTQLHSELMRTEMQRSLRFIYSTSPDSLAAPRFVEELEAIESVLNTYDLIGFRIKQGVLPKDATLATEWAVLRRLWRQLEPFVQNERLLRGDVTYKEHFEWLVRCVAPYSFKRGLVGDCIVLKREFGSSTSTATPFGLRNGGRNIE